MDEQVSTENQRAARDAVRVLIAVMVLTIFSATAIANDRQPGKITHPRLNAPTVQPTKSPTFQRRLSVNMTPLAPRRAQSLASSATIPGQTQVDTYTVALYHLDSQIGSAIPDATGIHTATLTGNATVTSDGLYGGALRLDGNASYLRTGDLGSLPQGTIEAYVDFSETCTGVGGYFPVFSAGGDYLSNLRSMSLRNNGYLDFQIMTPSGWVIASSGINPCRYLDGAPGHGAAYWPYETWRFHHVAVTWGPRGTEIWVDGVLHGVGNDWIIPASTPAPSGPLTPVFYGGVDWCNPQSQFNGGGYPYCKTPVLPPPYASGDYTGTLPAYANFLVGCDADADPMMYCFKGRIDEVRISNIQRQFFVSVVPTSTPTPTQTPDVISSAYTIDAHTRELYHLDSELSAQQKVFEEVSAAYSAQVWGNAAVVSGGRFNSGLSLDGSPGSYVNLGNLNNPAGSAGVIEAWTKLGSATNLEIITSGAYDPDNIHQSNVRIGVDTSYGNTVQFGVKDSLGIWHWANSGVNPSAFVGAWHHVAGTFGPRGLEIWVDGKLCGTDTYTGYTGQYADAYLIGCDAQHRCMQGMVDEVRFSDIQRSFTFSSSSFSPSRLRLFSPSTGFQLFFPLISGSLPALCGVSPSAPVSIQSIP